MSPLGRFLWRWRRTAWWDGYYQGWADAEGGHQRLRDRAERLRLYDSPGTTTRTSQALAADCTCTPCPGRGNDGECCFGSGIEDADPACPVVPHRSLAALSAAPADPPAEQEEDARETLRALSEAAAPGPWYVPDDDPEMVRAVDDIDVVDAFALSGPQTRATAAFIAASANHVRAALSPSPAATTDQVIVEGQRVPVVVDPELVPRGMTDWWPLTIRLREYDRGVLLHEVLHVALHSGPTGERIPPDSHLHEPTAWRCTRAVAAFLGWDLPPVDHEPESPRTAVVLDLDDPFFDGQTLPDALRDYEHVHSTTGVCVKNVAGPFCAQPTSPPATTGAGHQWTVCRDDFHEHTIIDSITVCLDCGGLPEPPPALDEPLGPIPPHIKARLDELRRQAALAAASPPATTGAGGLTEQGRRLAFGMAQGRAALREGTGWSSPAASPPATTGAGEAVTVSREDLAVLLRNVDGTWAGSGNPVFDRLLAANLASSPPATDGDTAAEAVECPTCRAIPGMECLDRGTGDSRDQPHQRRVALSASVRDTETGTP